MYQLVESASSLALDDFVSINTTIDVLHHSCTVILFSSQLKNKHTEVNTCTLKIFCFSALKPIRKDGHFFLFHFPITKKKKRKKAKVHRLPHLHVFVPLSADHTVSLINTLSILI